MSIFEYNEELHIRNEREISYQEGLRKGLQEGKCEGLKEGLREGKCEGLREGKYEGLREGIRGTVSVLRKFHHSEKEIKELLIEQYDLTAEEAEGYFDQI